MTVYVLHHVHTFADGGEDVKLIGVYSSKERAQQARESAKGSPGFRDTPQSFKIERHSIDPQELVLERKKRHPIAAKRL